MEDEGVVLAHSAGNTELTVLLTGDLDEGDGTLLDSGVSYYLVKVGCLSLSQIQDRRAYIGFVFVCELLGYKKNCDVRRSEKQGYDQEPDGDKLSFIQFSFYCFHVCLLTRIYA